MRNFVRFREMIAKYQNVADFLCIYVNEAHPTDGWVFQSNKYKIANHKTIEDRVTAAKMLQEELGDDPCPLVVDSMENKVQLTYKAMPERYAIILDGVVVYYGRQGPMGYQPEEVLGWLEEYVEKNQN